jgi:hypothetical protein
MIPDSGWYWYLMTPQRPLRCRTATWTWPLKNCRTVHLTMTWLWALFRHLRQWRNWNWRKWRPVKSGEWCEWKSWLEPLLMSTWNDVTWCGKVSPSHTSLVTTWHPTWLDLHALTKLKDDGSFNSVDPLKKPPLPPFHAWTWDVGTLHICPQQLKATKSYYKNYYKSY